MIITCEASEAEFMEAALNMRFAGLEVMLPVAVYALAKRWDLNKLNYYLNLLEIK